MSVDGSFYKKKKIVDLDMHKQNKQKYREEKCGEEEEKLYE